MSRREKISKRPLPPRKLPTECLSCGAENPWELKMVEFTAPFRATSHEVSSEAFECRNCNAVTTTDEHSNAISAKIREAHAKWVSEKLKRSIKELDTNLRDLAQKTGIPFATLGRISGGNHLPEASIEKLLWLQIDQLMHTRMNQQWIQMEQSLILVVSDVVKFRTPEKISASAYAKIFKYNPDFVWEANKPNDWNRTAVESVPCEPILA